MDSHLRAVLPVSTSGEWTPWRKLRWIQLPTRGYKAWRWLAKWTTRQHSGDSP